MNWELEFEGPEGIWGIWGHWKSLWVWGHWVSWLFGGLKGQESFRTGAPRHWVPLGMVGYGRTWTYCWNENCKKSLASAYWYQVHTSILLAPEFLDFYLHYLSILLRYNPYIWGINNFTLLLTSSLDFKMLNGLFSLNYVMKNRIDKNKSRP